MRKCLLFKTNVGRNLTIKLFYLKAPSNLVLL